MNLNTSRRWRTAAATLLTAVLVVITPGCGGGGGNGGNTQTVVEGQLLDQTGKAFSEVSVFIFETHEGSLTDEGGTFSISSYTEIATAKFFIQISPTLFSDTIDLGPVPEGVTTIRLGLVLDRTTNQLTASQIAFDFNNEPNPTPVPTTAPGETPRPTPTPKPPLFDAEGNTTSFGIPAGMSGNISAGRAVWTGVCQGCHASGERANRTYGQIKSALATEPEMRPLRVSNQKVADVTAYLNRNRR